MQEPTDYFDPFEEAVNLFLKPQDFISALKKEIADSGIIFNFDYYSDEALRNAVQTDFLEKALFCLENNIKPNYLAEAIKRKNPQMTALLLAYGADDKSPEALNAALKANSISLTKYFLKQNKNNANIPYNDLTPLIIACTQNKHIELVRLLIENGADVNKEAVIKKGQKHDAFNKQEILEADLIFTPLAVAISANDMEKAELLLNNEADANSQIFYKSAFNLLEQAYSDNNPDLAALLIVKGGTCGPVIGTEKHNQEIISMLYDSNYAYWHYAKHVEKNIAGKKKHILQTVLKQNPKKIASWLMTLTGLEEARKTQTLTDILPYISSKDRMRFFVVHYHKLSTDERKRCEKTIRQLGKTEPLDNIFSSAKVIMKNNSFANNNFNAENQYG